MERPLRLYDYLDSGNGYKVRLLLAQLERPFELTELAIMKGETHRPEFLEKSPDGRVPVLELADGTCLAESNAILFYLAEGTRFLPASALERARALQWMFFEQYSHEPNVAVARFIMKHLPADHPRRAALGEKREGGHKALAVMDRQLSGRPFLVGEDYSVADIALYAYTHVAGEGGIDLAPYPAVGAWLDRVKSQANHVLITDRPG